MGKDEKRSIIKDRHIAELETWLSTQEAARRLGVSRQGVINLARDPHSPVRAVHVGKSGESKGSEGTRRGRGQGYWIFDPYSVQEVLDARRGSEVRAREEAERRDKENTKRLIDRAEGRS